MSAKQAANQETKIAACPMQGCGGECYCHPDGIDDKMMDCPPYWIDCKKCNYQSGQNSQSAAIAAHNALATASARPKDVGPVNSNYRQIAFDIAEKIGVETANALGRAGDEETIRLYRVTFYDFITTKLSELMQPKDVAGLEEAVRGCADEIIEFFVDMRQVHGFQNEVADIILAAARPFCDPETLRQREILLKACQSIASVDSPGSMPQFYDLNGGPLGVIEKMVNEATKAIADCKATK